MAREKILVVDDEPGVRTALEGILRDEGFDVTTCESGEAALAAIDSEAFDAALLDIWLPGLDGIETLMELRERRVDLEVVMISGHGTIDTAVRATKLGAFDFIEKPLSLDKTLLVLRNALRQRRLELRNRRLLEQLTRDTEILGRSRAMERVRSDVAAAAATDTPVLICGEPGTGREMVARRIHATGPRSAQAFVEIPCAGLDAAAAAAALFGEGDAPGRIAMADGGSLFLKEVHALAPTLQRRLAGQLGRMEERAPHPRPLASASPEASGVEPSLLPRLDVLRINVPPLRSRREDVPVLAERFLSDLAQEYGRPQKRLAPESLAALRNHDWPGNVRELKNLTERLTLLAPDEAVRVTDLPEELGGAVGPAADLYGEFASLAEGLETFERYYLRRVVDDTAGDRSAAAARLGLDEATLRERLRHFGLD